MAQATNQERPKDPIIGARSTIKGKSSKGDDKLSLYFSVEQAETLLAETQKELTVSEGRGIKFDIYTRKKTNTENGRTFDSSFMFVKATQESSRGSSGGGAAAPAVARKFVPKKVD